MITIDGSDGEGGGQMLRTALSLAMVTGHAFRIEHIRGRRKKPGLLRQHLTCVVATERISGARITGAELGSTELTVKPGEVRAGDYAFAIGTAGSTGLLFQCLLPALLAADAPSRLTLSGGTHNSAAPTYDYLAEVFLPLLARMGGMVTTTLRRPGFYPAGGGEWQSEITPGRLQPLTLETAGRLQSRSIIADVSNMPFEIAEREVAATAHLLGWPAAVTKPRTVKADGPGNVLAVSLTYDNLSERFTGFGERGVSAEAVASGVADEVRDYLVADVPVGGHLADQLMVPLALAGSGHVITVAPTQHSRSNAAVIEKFLPVEFTFEQLDDRRWRLGCTS